MGQPDILSALLKIIRSRLLLPFWLVSVQPVPIQRLRALVDAYGGTGPTDPDESQQVILDLAAGQYILVGTTVGTDGTPGFAHGLLKPLTVTTKAILISRIEPHADVSLNLKDISAMVVPSTLSAGRHVFKVTVSADSSMAHQLIISKLLPGKTLDDLKSWVRANRTGLSPQDDEGYGSTAEFGPGKHGWLIVDLVPGNYVAWSDQPGTRAGDDQFLEGEYATFTVSGAEALTTDDTTEVSR